jgi:hypothetical protein
MMWFSRSSRSEPSRGRSAGRHADSHVRPVAVKHGATAAIATAVVLGIVLGAGVTLAVSWPIGHSGSVAGHHHQRARLSAQRDSSPRSTQQQAVADQRKRCLDAVTATRLPLRRAASSIQQWEVHVGAMNQLVTGAITLQQASAFWNRTRVGARHRVERFERAWGRLQRRGVDCPAPGMLPSGSPQRLRSCSREVSADMRVLHAAAIAIHTWRRHVGAMNMLRMGKMSPSTATSQWLAMWHRGQHEIETYRAAALAAARVPGCSTVSPTSATVAPQGG